MRKSILFSILVLLVSTVAPQDLLAGKGFTGNGSNIVVPEEPDADSEEDSAMPDTVEGPLNDRGSTAGSLFGDLYKIRRYQGGEIYTQYTFSYDTQNRITGVTVNPDAIAVGGEPVLSDVHGYYAAEVIDGENVTYALTTAIYPSQCAQPIADFAKWGDISPMTGLDGNRLPLIVTYDATWTRSECEVGELIGQPSVDENTGVFTTPDCSDTVDNNCINRYFIKPETIDPDTTCPEGIRWTDLVDEVRFGRLNLGRSPETVLQAAFDEAISAINSADTIWISRDAAGRLLLEKNVYSDTDTDECGNPVWLGTTVKAIDSPLENLALYMKIMKDGHLVTPGDERTPIDSSTEGGSPLWKLLELSDGPSDDLRPTVDINALRTKFEFPNLVDVSETEYFTYFECYDSQGQSTNCLCEAINPDGTLATVACEAVDSRELLAVEACPDVSVNPNAATCEGPWVGIRTDGNYAPHGADFDFAAAFLAAAADKTGEIDVDMVVYINSVLGINKVTGYSAYNTDGTPLEGAIDYSKFPEYFDFGGLSLYDRYSAIGARGASGSVEVLQPIDAEGTWKKMSVYMLDAIGFSNHALDALTGLPTSETATMDILGFTQMADDNLSIIEFVHRYQIPELR